jgi:hypothetical protein
MKPQEDELLYETENPTSSPAWSYRNITFSIQRRANKDCSELMSTKGRFMNIGNSSYTEGIPIAGDKSFGSC